MGEEKREMTNGAETAGTEEAGDIRREEKKYTDADLDRILAKKIAAERQRMSKLFQEGQQETEMEKRERNVQIRELKADAKDALIADGFPYSLAGLLSYESKEAYEDSYREVTGIFRKAVEQTVKDRLRGSVPKTGSAATADYALRNAFAPKAR